MRKQFVNILEYYRTFYLVAQFADLRRKHSGSAGETSSVTVSPGLKEAYDEVLESVPSFSAAKYPTVEQLHNSVPPCLSIRFVRYEDLVAQSPDPACSLSELTDFLGICGAEREALERALALSSPASMKSTFGNKAFGFRKQYFTSDTGLVRKFEKTMDPADQDEAASLMNLLLPPFFGYA